MANLSAVASDGVSIVYIAATGSGTNQDPFVVTNALPSGTVVGLDSASLAALENITATISGTIPVSGTVSVGNFPATFSATQSGAWTVAVNNFPATQPISAASLPLPDGAATSANQTTIIGHIDGIETLLGGGLTVNTGLTPLTDTQLRADPVPVSGTFWQATQPVSVASLPLPDQAATSANQDTGNTRIGDLTETAPASDTGSSGLNGRLQRIAQRLTSLIAQLPATLGIKTAANSLSVAPASDSVFATYGSLTIPPHDYISNTWTDGNLTQVVYKTGGAGGTTVATLTMTYDGSNNLLTVTKS
jgi:hypothetical protein